MKNIIINKIKNKNDILDKFISENESIFNAIEEFFTNYKDQPELFGNNDHFESRLKKGSAFKKFKKTIAKISGDMEVGVDEDFDLSEKLGGTSVLLDIESENGGFLSVILNDNDYEEICNIQVGNRNFYIETVVSEKKGSQIESILVNEMLIKSNQEESKYKLFENNKDNIIRVPLNSIYQEDKYNFPAEYDVEMKIDFNNEKFEFSKIFIKDPANIKNNNFGEIETFYKKNFKDLISHIKDGNEKISKIIDLMQIAGEEYANDITKFNSEILLTYKNALKDFDYKFNTGKRGLFSFLRNEPW